MDPIRPLLTKFSREAQFEERTLWVMYEKQAMDKARAAGIQIIEVSAADKKVFQDAVKPIIGTSTAPNTLQPSSASKT